MHGTVTSGRHVLYPPASLPQLRALLEEHRRFRLEQLAELAEARQQRTCTLPRSTARTDRAADDRAAASDHTADTADTARNEVSAALAAAARQALEDIEVALDLMDTGQYGRCLDCDAAIPPEQLLAVPQAVSCVACQHAAE